MKPETAAAIAKKIGMARGDRHWYDPDGDNIYFQPDEEAAVLSHYLATGDRPLRVWDALVADGWRLQMRSLDGKTVVLAMRGGKPIRTMPGEMHKGIGKLPKDALLACAAALEEGR